MERTRYPTLRKAASRRASSSLSALRNSTVFSLTSGVCQVSAMVSTATGIAVTRAPALRLYSLWLASEAKLARPALSQSPAPAEEVKDQRNYGKDQQDVDQSAGNVENAHTQKPRDQQCNEQNCEDAHITSSRSEK